jgi:hypothetical protein
VLRTTLRITTFSIKGLHVTLSISDSQYNNALPLWCVSLRWVPCLLLIWMSFCWVSLCWVSLCWVSLCWVPCFYNIKLNVILLSIVMPSVIMLSVLLCLYLNILRAGNKPVTIYLISLCHWFSAAPLVFSTYFGTFLDFFLWWITTFWWIATSIIMIWRITILRFNEILTIILILRFFGEYQLLFHLIFGDSC